MGFGFRATHWGNIRVTLGLYWDNGKQNGNYYIRFLGFRVLGLGFRDERT